jgi:hypothetical protein
MQNFQTNFTAGQIDELLDGRVDLAKYNNGLKVAKNGIIFQQGGFKGRAGTRYVAPAKFDNKKFILLPFSFNISQNYVLEVGDQYLRIFTLNGRLEVVGVPVEVATPYLETQVFQLKITQTADVLYITHPSHHTKQLNRIDATTWTLTDFLEDPPATIEPNLDLAQTLTLNAASGLGKTATAGAAVFLTGDIDRQIIGKGGVAVITSLGGASPHAVANIDILTTFSAVNFASGEWFLTGSPAVGLTPTKKGPVNGQTTMNLDGDGFRAGDVGKYVRVWDGVVKITEVVNAQQAKGTILVTLTDVAKALAGTWTLEENTWSASRGYPRTVGMADQRLLFGGSNSQPDTVWASKVTQFNKLARGTKDADAFSHTLASNQVNMIEWISPQRDIIIGTSGAEWKMSGGGLNDPITPTNVQAKAQTYWGSESIMPVIIDRSTIFVQAGGTLVRAIRWDFDVDGYVADDLMLLAQNIGHPGVVQLTYEKLPVPLLWAVRSDGKLLSMTFDPSQEVMAWSEHDTDGEFLTACSIVSSDKKKYQTWVGVKRTINGVTKQYIEYFDQAARIKDTHPLLVDSGLSYDGTNNATTLTPGATTGAGIDFTAGAATFAAGDVGKQLYQINGNGRATITAFTNNTTVVATITVDFANTNAIAAGQWGLAVKTVTGLGHLEAKTVQIVGDGAAYPPKVVSAGSVTLDGPHALKIDAGLGFTPELTTLRPGINAGNGSVVFATKGFNRLYVLFHNTLGAKVNGEQIDFRSSAEPMGVAPAPKSGIFKVTNIGYDEDARINIKQEQPLPFCVLAIMGNLDVGDE